MPASEQKSRDMNKLPGIFISYRRTDNPDAVGRIYDRLASEFGKSRVFKDVDSIPLGQDFRSHLNDIVGNCVAVLAIIGPKWTDIRSETGQRRLDDPDDFVRIELEAALARNVPVVPVLVGHAVMPATGQLPASLSTLAFRQSIDVRPDPDFHNDATRLVAALKAIIDPNAPQVQPLREKQERSWLPWLASLAAATTLAAIALAIPALKHLRETPPPETRVEIVTPATDRPTDFALSPDGRQIVFVAKGDGAQRLWLRSLAVTTAQPLPGTEGANAPFWSPDGRSVGFFAFGAMRRLDLGGGRPQVLASVGNNGSGTWSTDGVILYARGPADPIMRIAATGGPVTEVTKPDRVAAAHRMPLFLPDGHHFLFMSVSGSAPGIYLAALDDRAPVRLAAPSRFSFLPSGWLLWVQGGALVAQRLDLQKSTLIGEPLTVADGVSAVSVAATGLVAYRTGAARRRQLQWVDRMGAAQGTIGETDDTLWAPRVSPDGRRVAMSRYAQNNEDIWLLEGARASRMTFDAASDSFPVWSPDGTRIVFLSNRTGSGDLYEKVTTGAGMEKLFLASDQYKYASGWSADGRFLLYFSIDPKTGGDLWVLPMAGERKPYVFLKTAFIEVWGQFSPDGKWVAYQSNETGREEIYVRPFIPPDAASRQSGSGVVESQWQVSTDGGVQPVWRFDGKEIFFINPAGEMMAAPITANGSTFMPGAPVKLFQTHVMDGGIDTGRGRQYDVARDGRFLINAELDAGDIAPITLIQNWNPEAKK
jgi:Tol biopolymer transport system component